MQLYIDYFFLSCWKLVIDDAVNITSELHDLRTLVTIPAQKRERPNREHWCGAGRIPSEGKVRTILTTLEC